MMQLRREIIEANYNIEGITSQEYETLRLTFRRALDFYWQYSNWHHTELAKGQKEEMDQTEALGKKMIAD